RTFDEIVEAHADPDRAAQILANPFYQSLSSSFAGTQEYMAMEKLGQLRHSDEWDLIVVDTPPSRSALDFLDAPQRLSRFLDGRLIRLLTAPTRAGGRAYLKVVNAGLGVFTSIVTKVLGAQMLRDVQTFLAAAEALAPAAGVDSGVEGGNGHEASGAAPEPNGEGRNGDADGEPRYPLTVAALRLHAERMQLIALERRVAEHFTAAHPGVPV